MGIFSKLFPSRETRLTKEIIGKIARDRKPIANLAAAIATAGMSSGTAMKSRVRFETEDKTVEQAIYVCFEYLYFFIHMVDRGAYARLGADRRTKLMNELEPLIVGPAIDAFFGHWPEDLKTKMRGEFRSKLNKAQAEYARCRGLLSEENPITGDSLFSMLARHVSELCGQSPTDPATHLAAYGTAIEAWKQLQLDRQMTEIAKVL